MEDYAFESCMPFIWYLGEAGIVPKVIEISDVIPGIVEFRHEALKGRRLSSFKASHEKMQEIMAELGKRMATVSNFYLIHPDLIASNIVIDNDIPYIIDWLGTSFVDADNYDPYQNRDLFIELNRASDPAYLNAFRTAYDANINPASPEKLDEIVEQYNNWK